MEVGSSAYMVSCRGEGNAVGYETHVLPYAL